MKTTIYPSVREFMDALDQMGLSLKEIVKSVGHERAHLEKARELGYKADYCITKDEEGFVPGIRLQDSEKVTRDHLVEIISAPEILSLDDLSQLKSLGIQI